MKNSPETHPETHVVAALYHFVEIGDPPATQARIKRLCQDHGVKGTILVAGEGINGTIAGARAGIDAVLAGLRGLPGCGALEHKESFAAAMPFLRLRVRLKKEIVTLGRPEVSPAKQVGTYVAPADWNDLIAADDVAVIDTRNDYEVAIGSFAGAIDPETTAFGEFPDWWAQNRERFHNKKIAMFCTGGIRCEKASSFLLDQGVEEVFHLKGGILKYLEDVPEEDSSWQGACFVFDQRVAVTHGLKVGDHALCFACRRPVSPQDQQSRDYVKGISCPACISEFTEAERGRFRERQKQIELAKKRGERHLGN